MARYVDTKQGKYDVRDMEMLYNAHIARLGYQNRDEVATLYKEQRDRLSTALKEDVVPVVHASFILDKTNLRFLCTNCKTEPPSFYTAESVKTFNYCPNCGARIDGKEEG